MCISGNNYFECTSVASNLCISRYQDYATGCALTNLTSGAGNISIGYQADLIFWDLKSINEIPYWMGSDRIINVMKKGNLVE